MTKPRRHPPQSDAEHAAEVAWVQQVQAAPDPGRQGIWGGVVRPEGDTRTRWLVEQSYEITYVTDVLADTRAEAQQIAYRQYADGLLSVENSEPLGIFARPLTEEDVEWEPTEEDEPPPRPHIVVELPEEDQL